MKNFFEINRVFMTKKRLLSFLMVALFSATMFADDTYTVAGDKTSILGSSWNASDKNNDMNLIAGTTYYKLEKSDFDPIDDETDKDYVTLEYKVVKNHSVWPSGDNWSVNLAKGATSVSFFYNALDGSYNAFSPLVLVGGTEIAQGEFWNNLASKNLLSTTNGYTYTLTVKDVTLEASVDYAYKLVEFGSWVVFWDNGKGGNATFSVAEDGVYDIEYSYNAVAKTMTITPTKTGGAVIVHTYSVAGETDLLGVYWDATKNQMTKQPDGTYQLVKEGLWLEARSYEYKICTDESYTQTYPSGSSNASLAIAAAGKYDVTFTLDLTKEEGKEYSAVAELKENANFYITGDWLEWNAAAIHVSGAANSYKFEGLKGGKDYKLKVIPKGSWDDPNYGYDNLTSKNDGLYKDKDGNVCFQMVSDGDVTVEFEMDGDDVKTFEVTGDYYVPAKKIVKFVPWKWAADGAKFAATIKGARYYEGWTPFFSGSGDTLSVEISGRVDSIKFVRFAPGAATPSWESENWNNTSKFDSINSGLVYTINDWYSGTWNKYEPTVTIFGWNESAGKNVELSFAADRLKPSAKLTLTKGSTYEFKVVLDGTSYYTKDNGGKAYNLHRDHKGVGGVTDWTWEDPGITVTADMTGEYEFTWLLAKDSVHVEFPDLPDPEYYLSIGFNEQPETWKNHLMTEVSTGVWSVDVDLVGKRTDYRFKIFRLWPETTKENQYFGATQGDNSMYYGHSTGWTLTSPGENINMSSNFSNSYSFEFIPESSNQLNVIYPTKEATAIDNTQATVKAVKSIENGMLIIEKNGVKYNAQGQVIK